MWDQPAPQVTPHAPESTAHAPEVAAPAGGGTGVAMDSSAGGIPPVAAFDPNPPAAPPTASELAYGPSVTPAEARAPEVATPEVKPDAKPTTLGPLLAAESVTIDQLKTDQFHMTMFAKKLLVAKGIAKPTNSQLDETKFKLGEAITANTWQTFEAPFGGQVLKTEDGVNDRLGNLFGEKKVFTPEELEPDNLKMTPAEAEKLHGGYESGISGMVLSASFINTGSRSEGDFSRAYGDEAGQGFLRAEAYLQSIPKGQFIEQLSIATMSEVNRLIHAPDVGLKAKLLRTVAAIGRGEFDHGGKLRGGKSFYRPEQYSAVEMANMKEAGVGTKQLTHDDDGGGKAMLQYPKPEEIAPGLERVIAELRADLAEPDADQIGAAAKFHRHFVALHPFGDSNGRTGRILMNRILGEFDMSPAIFADQNKDISLSPEEWRTEVAKGVARSKAFLGSSRVESKDEYLGDMGIKAIEQSPNKPVSLDGNPFDLGTDGLLYDPTGRPWIVKNNEVIPLAQLEHFVISRRVFQAGKESGTAMLVETTAETRALYDRVAADPEAGESITVRDDVDARKADSEYKLAPGQEVGGVLATLTDVTKLDPATMFQIGGAKGTTISSTLSKYTQMDLELWYVERGLKDQDHDELVEVVRGHREKLFEMAKANLAGTKDATRVSSDNPMGFHFKYEQMMYETSPLRFATFDEAIDELGDNKMTVWRGDYSFTRATGMAPNNDIRQDDAKEIAEDRGDKSQLTNLYDDLVKLEGSAVGKQYICTTSDLALLTGAFADSKSSQRVNLGKLPVFLRDRVLSWMDPAKEDGATAETDAAKRKEEIDRGDSVVPTEDGKGKEIKDTMGMPGTLMTLKVVDREAGIIEVEAARKAFQIEISKESMLPGIYALGGPSFESEQEVHGLTSISPFKLKSAHEAKTLKEEFPITAAPAVEETPGIGVA